MGDTPPIYRKEPTETNSQYGQILRPCQHFLHPSLTAGDLVYRCKDEKRPVSDESKCSGFMDEEQW